MQKLKITAIVGSLRKSSLNRQLALQAKNVIADRADFSILDYCEIPLLNQDYEYPAPLSVSNAREIVTSSDGIWFFVAEYNHFLPGCLKNLIDWLSRPISDNEPQVLSGKPAAISGITPGITGTALAQDNLVTLISFLNMKVMNRPRLLIPNAFSSVNSDGELVLSDIAAPVLDSQVDDFLRFIKGTAQ